MFVLILCSTPFVWNCCCVRIDHGGDVGAGGGVSKTFLPSVSWAVGSTANTIKELPVLRSTALLFLSGVDTNPTLKIVQGFAFAGGSWQR